jgi:hypothetical protein
MQLPLVAKVVVVVVVVMVVVLLLLLLLPLLQLLQAGWMCWHLDLTLDLVQHQPPQVQSQQKHWLCIVTTNVDAIQQCSTWRVGMLASCGPR